jgi:hypothetical protein
MMGVKIITKITKEMTLDVVSNPSFINNKSLRVIVIEQVNYRGALGEVGMHLNGHKSIEVFFLYEIKQKY